MKKVMRKFAKFIVKTAVVAGVTKLAAMAISQKAEKDDVTSAKEGIDSDDFEKKAEKKIDEKAERAKELAKTGLHKGIQVFNETKEKAQKEKKSIERKHSATT